MTRLVRLRHERGWSQRELAAIVDKTQGAVSEWERNGRIPHPRTRVRLAAIFNVEPVEALFASVERDQ